MKIYNKEPGIIIAYWNAEDKADAKGNPVAPLTQYKLLGRSMSPDLPTGLAQKLLKDWPRRLSTDRKALEAEQALKNQNTAQAQHIADLENYFADVQRLMGETAACKDKKKAQELADRLDTMLANKPKMGQSKAEAPAAPAPASSPPPPPSEQQNFETDESRQQ